MTYNKHKWTIQTTIVYCTTIYEFLHLLVNTKYISSFYQLLLLLSYFVLGKNSTVPTFEMWKSVSTFPFCMLVEKKKQTEEVHFGE